MQSFICFFLALMPMNKKLQFDGIATGTVVYQVTADLIQPLANLIADQIADRLNGNYKAGVPVSTSSGPEWGTRQQAADLATTSLPTLHGLIREGLVETTKIGRRTSVNLSDLRAKLESGELAKYKRRNGE